MSGVRVLEIGESKVTISLREEDLLTRSKKMLKREKHVRV